MAARAKARRRALDILFESDVRDQDPLAVLDQHQNRRAQMANPPLNQYTVELVNGVTQHRREIDEVIDATSLGWTTDRMPAVDRAALRIGVWELLWTQDIPPGVAISEAVGTVRELSTDESPKFVNGLLAQVAKRRQEKEE